VIKFEASTIGKCSRLFSPQFRVYYATLCLAFSPKKSALLPSIKPQASWAFPSGKSISLLSVIQGVTRSLLFPRPSLVATPSCWTPHGCSRHACFLKHLTDHVRDLDLDSLTLRVKTSARVEPRSTLSIHAHSRRSPVRIRAPPPPVPCVNPPPLRSTVGCTPLH